MQELTTIEEQIIDLFTAGLNNNEISATLNITPNTTICYMTTIYKKLKAKSNSK